MSLYTLLPLFASALGLFLLAFVWGRGLKTDLQKSLFALIACVTLWAFFDFVIWNGKSYPQYLVHLLYKMQMPTYLFLGSLLFIFVSQMLKKPQGFFYKTILIWPIIATLIGWFSPYVTVGFKATYWGLIHEPGFLFAPLTIVAGALPAEAAIIIIIRSVGKSYNKDERNQRLLVAFAAGIVLHVGLATNIVIPHWLGMKDFLQLGSCTVTLFALCLFISVSKYDMIPISVESVIDELFDTSKRGVVMVDKQGFIVQANATAEALLERSISHDDHTRIEELFPLYSTGDERLNLDLSEERSQACHLQVRRNRYMSKGRENGWVYTIDDVTKEKLSELEILSLNSSLELRVKERTDDLENSNARLLLQTQELAELGRYKSEFMANLSHEIRTPMNAVMGFTDLLLLNKEMNYESNEYLKNIKENSLSLLELLNDLLDFSKIENGKIQYESIPVNLSNLVYDACDLVRARLESKTNNLHLFVDLPEFTYEFLSDPLRLKQVLINLLSNAVKFTESGHVLLRMSVVGQSELFQELKFEVIDTGVGIAKEEQERIFKAFIQADGSTTRKFGGTGLGLTISSQIVEGMGGQVALTSELGKGSNFHFNLKLRTASELKKQVLDPRPKVLLHIEKEEELSFIEPVLTRLGTNLVVAKSIQEAGTVLQHFDWLVIDGKSFKTNYEDWESALVSSRVRIVIVDANLRGHFKCQIPEDRFYRMSHPVSPHAVLSLFSYAVELNRETHVATVAAMNILMAEDNTYNQSFQRTLLEGMGHTVVIANNGVEALALFSKEDFDIVFVDIHMPEMNGIELVKRIRKINTELPVIGITANVSDRVRQDSLAAGMNWFLEKPLDIRTLEKSLKVIMPV
jgi:signal transduction histidine kinase/CheY-like chemotaxis protein